MQAQIVNLLRRLQRELNLTYLFISHDLAIVRYISNRMAVMYLGKIVELGESRAVCGTPLHPYTQALWSAVPIADPELEAREEADPAGRRRPQPAQPTRGMPLPPPLPHGDKHLQGSRA